MNNQFALWLFPLVLLAIMVIVARARQGFFWSWSTIVQMLVMLFICALGISGVQPVICTVIAWAMTALFLFLPRFVFTQLSKCLISLDVNGLKRASRQLSLVYWDKTGHFYSSLISGLIFYIENEGNAADAVMAKIEKMPLPPAFREVLDGYRLTGLSLMWRWDDIISEFERIRATSRKAISSSVWLTAGRAFAEKGRVFEAAPCYEASNLEESRNTVSTVGLTLMSFFALAGSTDYLNRVLKAIDKSWLPDASRFYWTGRCLAAQGQVEEARNLFDQAYRACPETNVHLRRRIEFVKKQLDQPIAELPDYTDALTRVWAVFTRSRFVASVILPKKASRGIEVIIALNIIVYACSHIFELSPDNKFAQSLADTIFRFCVLDTAKVMDGQLWRPITYLFLHAHISHIALNMLGLFWFGRIAERIYGTPRFVVIYLVGGVFSAIAQMVFSPAQLAIGASGAVLGIFGCVAAGIYRMRKELPARIRRSELTWMAVIAILQVGMDHVIPNIAYWAHLGGMFGGFVGGLLIWPGPPVKYVDDDEEVV